MKTCHCCGHCWNQTNLPSASVREVRRFSFTFFTLLTLPRLLSWLMAYNSWCLDSGCKPGRVTGVQGLVKRLRHKPRHLWTSGKTHEQLAFRKITVLCSDLLYFAAGVARRLRGVLRTYKNLVTDMTWTAFLQHFWKELMTFFGWTDNGIVLSYFRLQMLL